jgi:ABC-type branched-subunit amino acid transport system substrate-binding protein
MRRNVALQAPPGNGTAGVAGGIISRRRLITRSLQGFALVCGGGAVAQGQREPFAIGAVLPSEVGSTAVNRLESAHIAAASARRGMLLADEALYRRLADEGVELVVYFATAPDTRSSERAASRMIAIEDAKWIVGGFSCSEVDSLRARVGDADRVLVNIGSTCDAVRRSDDTNVLHVEASASLYMDAIAAWSSDSGHDSWTIVMPDSQEGRTRLESARRSAGAIGIDVRAVSAYDPQAATFVEAIETHTRVAAAALVFLGGWHHQYDMLGQLEARNPAAVLYVLPDAVSQTRTHIDTSRYLAPRVGGGVRFSSWEPTSPSALVTSLSEAYAARWGVPMDGPAWAGYQAVALAVEGIVATGSTNPLVLRDFLVSASEGVSVNKDVPATFDGHGQLRHSTMVARVNPSAPARRELRYQLEWATFVSEHVHAR